MVSSPMAFVWHIGKALRLNFIADDLCPDLNEYFFAHAGNEAAGFAQEQIVTIPPFI